MKHKYKNKNRKISLSVRLYESDVVFVKKLIGEGLITYDDFTDFVRKTVREKVLELKDKYK